MGKKKEADVKGAGDKSEELKKLLEKQKKETEEATEDEELVPDTPIVKALKELDDQHMVLQKELEAAEQALEREKMEKQAPLLRARTEKLAAASDGATGATPGLKSFWLTALKNLPHTESIIMEWDEPVLEHLSDIRFAHTDSGNLENGFKLTFEFAENAFFRNRELVKEYSLARKNEYVDEWDIKSTTATKIEWNDGKDVTVEKTQKKVKGGGAKKAKQKGKVSEEPRPSFFRFFFVNLDSEGDIPEDMEQFWEDDFEDLLNQDQEIGEAILQWLVPRAIRWYTGEARPEGLDDDSDEDEEEEESDDEDDSEDEESDPPPPKKGVAKKGGKEAKPPAAKAKAAGGKDEECKQQ